MTLEEKSEYMKQWRLKNAERVKQYNLKHNAKRSKPARVERYRELKYGVSPSEFKKMQSKHNGMCWICRKNDGNCVDHNHETGFVRGVLCQTCNRAIGLLGDSIETLHSAAEYLTGRV